MLFDTINFDSLPQSKEEAFVMFERQIRAAYDKASREDREWQGNQDQNGEYCGSYSPERSYITSVLAFIDEYNLDIDLPDIMGLKGYDFLDKFEGFEKAVEGIVLRFLLRRGRLDRGEIGTIITISSTYKSEIGSLLETIRKIVNQEVSDVKKKDKIFSKIASLQSEIDREQTTVDALFGRMIDFTKTIGECAENIEPLINKLERLKKIFWEGSEKVELLPTKPRQHLIEQKTETARQDIDDEIPF